jgi:hypothetical protein
MRGRCIALARVDTVLALAILALAFTLSAIDVFPGAGHLIRTPDQRRVSEAQNAYLNAARQPVNDGYCIVLS